VKFTIHTLGTRGDLQPYLALAIGLRERGHQVLLIGPEQFGGWADRYDVPFAALPAEFLDVLESPEAKAIIGRSRGGFGAGFKLLKHYVGLLRQMLEIEWAAARDMAPDAVLYHPKALGAPHIALRLDVPSMLASPMPGFTPTSAFPTPLLPFANLGPLNRLSHRLMMHAGDALFARPIGCWRREVLGLERRQRPARPLATLYAYSANIVPRPADWGPEVAVTGYWKLPAAAWAPAEDLARFLAAGEAPVYVGFGSMPGAAPEALTRTIIEGLQRAGRRGLLATGGGALGRLDGQKDMAFIDGAPHEILFRHVRSAIHHGGAGTTGASLGAGLPTTICPFIGDQPFWGRLIAELGVGPKALNKRTLGPDDVARAVRAMDQPAMRAKAADLGHAIRAEGGLSAAIGVIEARLAA
jgi:sterol 3beta-glucosyltransferase